jgi:hypothetical protein
MAYIGTKPANQVIDSTLIADGTVTTADIADGAITNAKIASMAASKLTGQVPDANAPSGSVIQVVNVTNSTYFSTTSSSPVSTGISASITPSSASSKILVIVATPLAGSGQTTFNPGIYLYRGGSSIAATAGARNSGTGFTAGFNYLDSPATTSSTTYSLYIAVTTGTGVINDYTGSTTFITLMEIAA